MGTQCTGVLDGLDTLWGVPVAPFGARVEHAAVPRQGPPLAGAEHALERSYIPAVTYRKPQQGFESRAQTGSAQTIH